jgi:hypothetical protein
LQNDRVHHCRVQVERVERDPNFARIQDQRKDRRNATSNHGPAPRVKHANRLVQRLATLHERLPFRRIRQLRDHPGEESKHSAPLHKVKSADRRHSDERADDGRAEETSLAG